MSDIQRLKGTMLKQLSIYDKTDEEIAKWLVEALNAGVVCLNLNEFIYKVDGEMYGTLINVPAEIIKRLKCPKWDKYDIDPEYGYYWQRWPLLLEYVKKGRELCETRKRVCDAQ